MFVMFRRIGMAFFGLFWLGWMMSACARNGCGDPLQSVFVAFVLAMTAAVFYWMFWRAGKGE
jgi:hypothetical protein